jgi:hypothetical protein
VSIIVLILEGGKLSLLHLVCFMLTWTRVEYEKEKFATIKLDAVTMEYNFLLTSQLETQRAYFEKQVSQSLPFFSFIVLQN